MLQPTNLTTHGKDSFNLHSNKAIKEFNLLREVITKRTPSEKIKKLDYRLIFEFVKKNKVIFHIILDNSGRYFFDGDFYEELPELKKFITLFFKNNICFWDVVPEKKQ